MECKNENNIFNIEHRYVNEKGKVAIVNLKIKDETKKYPSGKEDGFYTVTFLDIDFSVHISAVLIAEEKIKTRKYWDYKLVDDLSQSEIRMYAAHTLVTDGNFKDTEERILLPIYEHELRSRIGSELFEYINDRFDLKKIGLASNTRCTIFSTEDKNWIKYRFEKDYIQEIFSRGYEYIHKNKKRETVHGRKLVILDRKLEKEYAWTPYLYKSIAYLNSKSLTN